MLQRHQRSCAVFTCLAEAAAGDDAAGRKQRKHVPLLQWPGHSPWEKELGGKGVRKISKDQILSHWSTGSEQSGEASKADRKS